MTSKPDGQRGEKPLGTAAPASAALDTGASQDLMRQPGGFVIRMAAENGLDPSRGFTAVPASKADVPTIRIITSNPAQQPAGYVAPIAFPGFSRGFSTVSPPSTECVHVPSSTCLKPTPGQQQMPGMVL